MFICNIQNAYTPNVNSGIIALVFLNNTSEFFLRYENPYEAFKNPI